MKGYETWFSLIVRPKSRTYSNFLHESSPGSLIQRLEKHNYIGGVQSNMPRGQVMVLMLWCFDLKPSIKAHAAGHSFEFPRDENKEVNLRWWSTTEQNRTSSVNVLASQAFRKSRCSRSATWTSQGGETNILNWSEHISTASGNVNAFGGRSCRTSHISL